MLRFIIVFIFSSRRRHTSSLCDWSSDVCSSDLGGAVTLGDVAGKLAMLDVACSKCERRGRLSVAKLIAEHGADAKLPVLRESWPVNYRSEERRVGEECASRYRQQHK